MSSSRKCTGRLFQRRGPRQQSLCRQMCCVSVVCQRLARISLHIHHASHLFLGFTFFLVLLNYPCRTECGLYNVCCSYEQHDQTIKVFCSCVNSLFSIFLFLRPRVSRAVILNCHFFCVFFHCLCFFVIACSKLYFCCITIFLIILIIITGLYSTVRS